MKTFLLGVFACVAIVALCGANAQRVAPKYKVERFRAELPEYDLENQINALAAQGWELVDYEGFVAKHVTRGELVYMTAIFKKE